MAVSMVRRHVIVYGSHQTVDTHIIYSDVCKDIAAVLADIDTNSRIDRQSLIQRRKDRYRNAQARI